MHERQLVSNVIGPAFITLLVWLIVEMEASFRSSISVVAIDTPC